MPDARAPQGGVAARLTTLLASIDGARRAAVLYPDTHPRFKAALEGMRQVIESLSECGEPVKLTVYKQECFLNGEPPEVPIEVPASFSDRFLRLGLATVVFEAGVTGEELGRFLRLLSTDARRGGAPRSLDELRALHGLERITLVPIDYGRLFAEGAGRPAEAGERDEEYFARLLTLWDPQPVRRMSVEEVEALGRLSQDRQALGRLLELSLKGPPVGMGGLEGRDGAPLAEGAVTALDALASRLRDLYPERWSSVRKTLVEAALRLDISTLTARRPDLLRVTTTAEPAPSPADEMSDAELADVLADALAERQDLGDDLAEVIRGLVPDRQRCVALQPLIASRLRLRGVPERARSDMLTWWEQRIVRGEGFRDGADPLFSALLAEPAPSKPVIDLAWFRDSLRDQVIVESYLDDLRGLVHTSVTPEDIEVVLARYHDEFVRLASAGDFMGLRELLEELGGELSRQGLRPQEVIGRMLSVTLGDRIAAGVSSPDPSVRREARGVACLFGASGFRVVMTALVQAQDWEVCEELRAEVPRYGVEAAEEALNWISHRDPRVVREALLVIRKAGSPHHAQKVRVLLGHRDPDVRVAALAALIRLGGEGRAEAVDACLRDPSPRVVQAALNACEELGVERFAEGLKAVISGHRDDPDFVTVRGAAIALVGSHRLVHLRDALKDIVRSAGSWTKYTLDDRLASHAAGALLSLGDPKSVEFVQKLSRWGIGKAGKACREALKAAKAGRKP